MLPPPLRHEIIGAVGAGVFVSDRVDLASHGFAPCHIDALCHMSHEGVMYNSCYRSDIDEVDGCGLLAVTTTKQGVVTRGIVVDIPHLRGIDYLGPGSGILPEDLEAWGAYAGVRVGPGDALLIRNGRWARRAEGWVHRAEEGPWLTAALATGLPPSVAPWLHERRVAVLGSDYTNDQLPSGVAGVFMPIRQLTLVAMGMPLFGKPGPRGRRGHGQRAGSLGIPPGRRTAGGPRRYRLAPEPAGHLRIRDS